MLQELIIAVRTLAKRPGYALSVIATLALGIGATTLMFSLVDAALIRPLPFADAHRLVFLTGVAGPQRDPRGGSFPEVGDWRSMNTSFTDVSMYDETSLNLRIGTTAVRVQTEMVNAGFFALLGAEPALGRTFLPAEDSVPHRDGVAVISHALWRNRFGGSRDVLHQRIHLNDRPFSIVGVMPEGFAGLSFDTDLWIPSMMVSLTSGASVVENRGVRWLGAIARLEEQVSLDRAQEDMNRVASILEQRHPESNRQRGVQVDGLRRALIGTTRDLVVSLFGAVVLFLVIACANVASLQIARSTSRRRELAVRLALGAGRHHIIRQLLTESCVLSVAAGALSLIVGIWALELVVALLPDGALPRYVSADLDLRAVAFAAGVSLVVGGLVAVLPALSASRQDLAGTMKQGARSAGPGLGSIRRLSPQQLLVVGEVAMAMTLLVAAGLMVRSLERQMRVEVGFSPENVTVARITLPSERYTPPQRMQFVQRLTERLRQIPGVSSAAVATTLPFTGNASAATLVVEGHTDPQAAQRYYRNFVTPDLFATLGIPVVRGRGFTDRDVAGAPPVAIINESAARRLWPDGEATGRRIRLGNASGPAVEVVGVIADARFRDLTTDLTAARVEPDVFFPFAQRSDRDLDVAVRTSTGSTISFASLQAAVSSLDESLPLYAFQTLSDAVSQQTSTTRFGSALLLVFSIGSLLLAGIGLYGLVSYVVGLSRREIAIRMALGASGRGVMRLVAGNGLALVAAGIVVGVGGSLLAARALESQLFQASTLDPGVLGGVAFLMGLVSIVAILVPTGRVVRADTQSALRGE
jgi:putative ABC transport system permease protein